MTAPDRRAGVRRRCRTAAAVLALTGSALVGSAAAEGEVDPESVVGGLAFLDQVEVTVVNIDVFVRDGADRPVTGLEKSDFRLLVDGIERPISHFAAYTEEVIDSLMTDGQDPVGPPDGKTAGAVPDAALPTPAVDERRAIQPVHVVIYVDNENLRPHDRNRVLSETRRFIRGIMQPHVRVMVVSAQRSTEVVQPFTDDPRAVQDALRSMSQVYGARVDADRDRGRLIHDLQEEPARAAAAGRSQALATARNLEEQIRVYGEQLSMELGYSITSLRDVLTTLAGLDGRKILVHVSNGLPAVPARDLIEWYGDIYQRTSVLPMLARFNRRPLFEALASTANAQGVTFYTIDAAGLGGNAAGSSEYSRPVDPLVAGIHDINLHEPLLLLAESTGGRALVGSNDVTGLLEELRDDLFTYYSLGHTLPASGADTIHRVEVDLPGHPELDVVYRRTLVEKSPETQVQDQVVSGLLLALDHNPMNLRLSAGEPSLATGGSWILPVELALPLSSIALLPEADDYVGRVVVFVANRDMTGRQSDIQRRQFEIRMPPSDVETRRDEIYVAEFDLLLNDGQHRIVVGVLDPVTRQTSFVTLERTLRRTQ